MYNLYTNYEVSKALIKIKSEIFDNKKIKKTNKLKIK